MLGPLCISEGFNFIFIVTYFELCFNLIYFGGSSLLKINALIHTVLVHVYLKITASKITTFINMALKAAKENYLSKFQLFERQKRDIGSPS